MKVEDSEYEDLLIHLPGLCDYIEKALVGKGGEKREKVLVHCVMGVSRSVTAVAAYREFSLLFIQRLVEFLFLDSDEKQGNERHRCAFFHSTKSVYHPTTHNPPRTC